MAIHSGHTSICVSDMGRARDFYCGVLGLKMSKDYGTTPADGLTRVSGSTMTFNLLEDSEGNQCVELFQFENIRQRKFDGTSRHEDFWSSHVCFLFDPESIDEVYQRIVDSGAGIDIPLSDMDGGKFAYVYDPDGYMVELVTWYNGRAE